VVAVLTRPPAADSAVAALGAAAHHPELATAVQHFFADRFAREEAVFDRARRRGELSDTADPLLIMDLLAGAVWLRVVFRGLPLDDDFAAKAVSAVLDGSASRMRPGLERSGQSGRDAPENEGRPT
jgi:hypothetical protein